MKFRLKESNICSITGLFIFFNSIAFSQPHNLHFEHFNNKYSNLNSSIRAIIQDTAGFLWIGTQNGLARYDGNKCEIFHNEYSDSSSISSDWIESLFNDSNGNLWIGTRRNLNLYLPQKKKFKRFYVEQKALIPQQSMEIYSISEFPKGRLWLATGCGLFSLDKGKDTARFHKFPSPYNSQRHYESFSVLPDGRGNLWLTTWAGIARYTIADNKVLFYDIAKTKKKSIETPYTDKLVFDEAGKLWITTWDAGLICMDTATGDMKSWKREIENPDGYSGYGGHGLMMEKDILWIATIEGGICAYNKKTNLFKSFRHSETDLSTISDNVVKCLYKDRSGIYWVGTDNGLDKFNPDAEKVFSKNFFPVEDSWKTVPFSLMKLDSENFLMGTYTGVYLLKYSTGNIRNINEKFETPLLKASNDMQRRGNIIYTNIGSRIYKIGIEEILSESKKQIPKKCFIDANGCVIEQYIMDDIGGCWVSTRNGLMYFDSSGKLIHHYYENAKGNYSLKNNFIIFIARDKITKELWCGIHSFGICRIKKAGDAPEYFNMENTNGGLRDKVVMNADFRGDSEIWFGTQYGGICVYDKAKNKFSPLSDSIKLPSKSIIEIQFQNPTTVWVHTDAGLCRIDLKTGIVVNINKDDDVFCNTFFLSNEGDVFIGDDKNKIHKVNLEALKQDEFSPAPIITSVKVNGSEMYKNSPGKLSLTYNDNDITIEFTQLSFHNPEKNTFQYMMEGAAGNWQEAGTNHSAQYPNLPPGNYKFRLRAYNADGVMSKSELSFAILISPPFWRTWWFYFLCLAAVIFITWLIQQWRVKRILYIQSLRNNIARDLHDDIGSTLSSISIFSGVAKKMMKDNPEKVGDILDNTSRRSSELMERMSDIVWTINPENDSLENIVARMKRFASELTEAKGMQLHFESGELQSKTELRIDVRRNLYLIFKEAINNAAKYSGASRISVSIANKGEELLLVIKDNGKGFDINKTDLGNGLKNMKKRAEEMGGKLTIESDNNSGTKITLEIHITRIRYV